MADSAPDGSNDRDPGGAAPWASGPQPSLEPSSGDAGGAPTKPPSNDRKVYEEVLQKALLAAHPPGAMLDEEIEALADVARRHVGQSFSLDPVAVDLVEAMLGRIYRIPARSAASWRPMSSAIAQSLFEDPVASERLRAIWSRLGEEAR